MISVEWNFTNLHFDFLFILQHRQDLFSSFSVLTWLWSVRSICQMQDVLTAIGLSNVALRTSGFDSDAIAANLLEPTEPI